MNGWYINVIMKKTARNVIFTFLAVFYMLFIRFRILFCCCSSRRFQLSSSSFCSGVRVTASDSSEKNWERLILYAVQIRSKEGKDGRIFFLYHEDIVDCGIPDSTDKRYSVQPRSERNSKIRCSTSIYANSFCFSYILCEISLMDNNFNSIIITKIISTPK